MYLSGKTAFPGAAALLPVAGAALLIVGGTASVRGIPRLLSSRPLTWIGDRSYGWYLWHWPFIVFAHALRPAGSWFWLSLAAMLSLLPTILSYRYLEDPIRRDSSLRGRRVIVLATACSLIPILMYLGLAATSTMAPLGPLRVLQAQNGRHADATRGSTPTCPTTP